MKRLRIIPFYDGQRKRRFDWVTQETQLTIKVNGKDILTSGRISSEIIYTVRMCKIPLIASVKAPTQQAVQMARKAHVTLIGFVRNDRMNVCSGEETVE